MYFKTFRDPLDHIATEFVLDANGGQPPKKGKIYFPISGSAADYPATRNGVIKGVRQEIVDAIDATEPYKGGKGHGLWQLKTLNNIQKHRRLIVGAAFYSGVDVACDFNRISKGVFLGWGIDLAEIPVLPPLYLRPADPLLPLRVGHELYRELLDYEMNEDRRFSFDVAFNAPDVVGCEPAIKTLQDLTNLVDALVAEFEPFLP